MIYDSHAHLISADIERYPPTPLTVKLTPGEFDNPMTAERLLGLMNQADVQKACAVQRAHVYGYHNNYILDACEQYPDRFSAVVVLNARDPATPDTLRTLKRERNIRGVRFSAPSFPEAPLDWLTSAETSDSWAAAADLGLPICIHVLYVQRASVLPVLKNMADKFPQARIVVDHVGGAHPAHVEVNWLKSQGKDIEYGIHPAALTMADNANVTMKFSTINFEGLEASHESFGKFMDNLINTFGMERLIWGSDIGQSRSDYVQMVNLARDAVAHLEPAIRQRLLFDNVQALYG